MRFSFFINRKISYEIFSSLVHEDHHYSEGEGGSSKVNEDVISCPESNIEWVKEGDNYSEHELGANGEIQEPITNSLSQNR